MVKRKITSLKLLLIAAIVIGWFVAMASLLGDKDAEEQQAILERAEAYAEDELYIRAVAAYQSALAYQTEKNPEIELKILEMYKELGDMESYYAYIRNRVERNVASEDEYLELAEYYLKGESYRQAIGIMGDGMKLFGEEKFIDSYEKIAYTMRIIETGYAEISAGIDSWPAAAKVEDEYVYIGARGYIAINNSKLPPFEEAYPFSEDYAVVKMDGTYALIGTDGYMYAVDKTGIGQVTGSSAGYITAETDGKYALYTHTFSPVTDAVYADAVISPNGLCFVQNEKGDWGIIDSEGELVVDFIYKDVAINSRNHVFEKAGRYFIAMVEDDKGWFLIDEKGNEINEARYEDAKGVEGGWIAVSNGSRWGFADFEGKLVIDYQYKDAYSFSNGLAAVNHGGEWDYITKSNRMLTDIGYEQAYPFVGGKAVAVKMGYYQILELRYFDLL